MKSIVAVWVTIAALTIGAAIQNAIAHTQEWYADHLVDARATQSRCLAQLKPDENLSQAEMTDCRRAGDAVARSGKFTPSAQR